MTSPVVHHRRLKVIEFSLDLDGTPIQFECQLSNWELDPGEQDGDRRYTFCPDGEFEEETDAEPSLSLTFFADWREDGISDFLWSNRGQVADALITHHPDTAAETVMFAGKVRLKAPPVGGEARTTEEQEVTLLVTELGYSRPTP